VSGKEIKGTYEGKGSYQEDGKKRELDKGKGGSGKREREKQRR